MHFKSVTLSCRYHLSNKSVIEKVASNQLPPSSTLLVSTEVLAVLQYCLDTPFCSLEDTPRPLLPPNHRPRMVPGCFAWNRGSCSYVQKCNYRHKTHHGGTFMGNHVHKLLKKLHELARVQNHLSFLILYVLRGNKQDPKRPAGPHTLQCSPDRLY